MSYTHRFLLIPSNWFLLILILHFATLTVQAKNKYLKEVNMKYQEVNRNPSSKEDGKITSFKEVVKPFRMNKLNVVWDKAILKLTETKLKSLYGDLKLQDKEELQLKRLKADGQDKEGLMEADIRRKLKGILNNYSLTNSFEEDEGKDSNKKNSKMPDDYQNRIHKKLFKDKKLNRLWEKAEKSGFTETELKTLKEEFSHHQDKLDEYYNIMESLTAEEKNLMHNDVPDINALLDDSNDGPVDPSTKKLDSKYNSLSGTHRELKESYDKLHRKTVSAAGALEFSEPRVEKLWRMALDANFTSDELSSLRTELKHYEKRIEKLNHIQAEYVLKSQYKDKSNGHEAFHHTDKDMRSIFEDKIKRHERVVEKLHAELEDKLKRRFTEEL